MKYLEVKQYTSEYPLSHQRNKKGKLKTAKSQMKMKTTSHNF